MLVITTDPITGNDINNLDEAPYSIEGQGKSAVKIYFESEYSQQEYKENLFESLQSKSVDI